MATAVILPKVDMVMERGTFVEWLKEEGDQVEKGEPLFVIMTDKASIEVDAPASGILAGVRAKPDDVIPVAEVLAFILQPGELPPADLPVSPATHPPELRPETAEALPVLHGTGSTPEAESPPASLDKVRATPVARKLAAQYGVDLTRMVGRGPQGRIQKEDVLAQAQLRAETPAPMASYPQRVAPTPAFPAVQVQLPAARQKAAVRLTGPRRIIADRMAYSAFTAPHITLNLTVDMTEAARLRTHLAEVIQRRTGQRLSHTAILARAVVSVLPHHPYLNASLSGDEIIQWEDVHLGIATSIDDYLVVPVLREAQMKSMEQIVTELGHLVERARSRRLLPSEMAGGTFTISNLGMFGIESFTAIINPPESAILAVGQIVEAPRLVDGQIQLRPTMQLTLSADHRVVDGATAARFLADLKAAIENPYPLLMM